MKVMLMPCFGYRILPLPLAKKHIFAALGLPCPAVDFRLAGVADNAEAVFSQRRKLELDFGRGW